MDPRLSALLDCAFHRSPAREANTAMAGAREFLSAFGTLPMGFEVVLNPERSWEDSWLDLLPRFANFMESKGWRADRHPGVYVAIFHGDDLYIIQGPIFVAHLLDEAGLTPSDLPRLADRWRRSRAPLYERVMAPALPPPNGEGA